MQRAAVVTDVRGGEYFEDLLAVLDELAAGGLDLKVVFLEADEEALLHRYKETRRRHPLARSGRIVDGIREERELLAPLRERADVVIDTTSLTGGALRRRIATELIGRDAQENQLALTILTFGFKNGPPSDADLTLDVRFLPNPHYVDELRPLTGLDEPVREYVESGTQAGEFYGRLMPLLEFLLPGLRRRGQAAPDDRRRLHRRSPPLRHRRRPDLARARPARRRQAAAGPPGRRARAPPRRSLALQAECLQSLPVGVVHLPLDHLSRGDGEGVGEVLVQGDSVLFRWPRSAISTRTRSPGAFWKEVGSTS